MDEEDTCRRLLEKSKEAFVLAVELYNRPSLRYHVEACSMFLCNAWELMLKAYMVRQYGFDSIYYNDRPDRTLSLSDCLKRIFTNEKDPLRVNMAEIIRLRNTQTHFITEEYEIFEGPFLQMGVKYYAEKLQELHSESVSELIPENHLVLTVRRDLINPETIRAQYEPRVASKLLERSSRLDQVLSRKGNEQAAAYYETNLRLVKRSRDADINVRVEATAEQGVAIIKDVRESSTYYPYTAKGCIENVNARLERRKVTIFYNNEPKSFNMWHFNLFSKVYNLKQSKEYSYDRSSRNEKNASYVYSERTIEFIVEQLARDPHDCIEKLKRKTAAQ